MTILDRYILKLFFKVVMVCSVSMIGLFIIIDLFEHLEEFTDLATTEGGLVSVVLQYYTPRALTFFDRTSGLLALISAIFVITLIKRSRELEAVMAGGIPLIRIVKPLFIGMAVVALAAIVNREILIPEQKDRLVREISNWRGDKEISLRPRYDYESEIFIAGKSAIASEKEIIGPIFQLPTGLQQFGSKIMAAKAEYQPASAYHPRGFLLTKVSFPQNLASIESAKVDGKSALITAYDADWLEPNECFIASSIDFDQLVESESSKEFASTAALVKGIRNPAADFGSQTRVAVHARMVQPFLDMSLLFVGIPIVISRKDRNIFMAIGIAMGLIGGFFVLSMASHSLGGYGLIRPALAAWIPLLVLLPFAWMFAQRMR